MEGGGSAALQLARDLLPGAPKRWPLLLALVAAYYAGKEVLPFLWQKSVKGDVAVITGGAGGIGRLMALRLAREGCKVVLLDINKAGLDAVAAEVAALGVTARAYVCDVSKREDIYRVCKQVEDDFGRVDILINNAGIVGGKTLLEADDNRMELTIRINTMALMWMTKALLPGMLRRNHGHVINVASSAGLVGVPGLVDYCASKFGAVGFDESLRIELKKLGTNVKTTCLCPMYIKTGMFEGAQLNPSIPGLGPLVNACFPLLEPQYVADEVINAMKRDQAVVVLPRMAMLASFFKASLPTDLSDTILRVLGVTSSMDKFHQTRPTQ